MGIKANRNYRQPRPDYARLYRREAHRYVRELERRANDQRSTVDRRGAQQNTRLREPRSPSRRQAVNVVGAIQLVALLLAAAAFARVLGFFVR